MSRVKEFLLCKGCGEFFEDGIDFLDIKITHESVTYECPICGTINETKNLYNLCHSKD